MTNPSTLASAFAAIPLWTDPLPEPLYHGSPYVFEAFDLSKCRGAAWFRPDFAGASAMARSFAREVEGSTAGVYVCQLTCERIAKFANETEIYQLGRIIEPRAYGRQLLSVASAALLAYGFDGIADCYVGTADIAPSFAALRVDAIRIVEYRKV